MPGRESAFGRDIEVDGRVGAGVKGGNSSGEHRLQHKSFGGAGGRQSSGSSNSPRYSKKTSRQHGLLTIFFHIGSIFVRRFMSWTDHIFPLPKVVSTSGSSLLAAETWDEMLSVSLTSAGV